MFKARAKGICLMGTLILIGLSSLIFLAGCASNAKGGLPAVSQTDSSSNDKGDTGSAEQTAPASTMTENSSAVYEKSESLKKETLAMTDNQMPESKQQSKMKKSLSGDAKDASTGTADESAQDQGATKPSEQEKTSDTSKQQATKPNRQPETKYLSADDSNSCASPVIVRKLINSGKYVQPALIRTYEFLNYYNFSYPAPEKDPIAILAEMRKLDGAGKYSLQIAVRSQNKRQTDLPPMNIIFLVDMSGSMAGGPINLARLFIENFVANLRPRDMLSIVICNRQAKVVLDSYQYNAQLANILAEKVYPLFTPNDITNLDEGITAAYKLANKNYQSGFLNRVILISDGAANAGTTAPELVGKYAEDSEKQGIYLAGIGVGEGLNDALMNKFTDKGRGAYLFLDSKEEVVHALKGDNFLANFDLAVKDVRLKMVIPPYWKMEEFHGEQVSSVASEIVPQYLAPNDQMIYHLVISAETDAQQKVLAAAEEQSFEFEAEYKPLGGKPKTENLKIKVADMLKEQAWILKGDAIVAYAEFFKKVKYPLTNEPNKTENLKEYNSCFEQLTKLNTALADPELIEILALLKKYERTLKFGEDFAGHEDKDKDTPAAALGLSPNDIVSVQAKGNAANRAIKAISRLLYSERLVPLEGYKFLALGSGPIGNPSPSSSGDLGTGDSVDPQPEYIGYKKANSSSQRVFDLHQVVFKLKAPSNAKSFSFDFNFFSAEYPNYVKQNFNDTFYAMLEAASTNNGKKTNISFDPNNNSMEVDNNYFQSPFHPIPNTGTGFDQHGSTGWLRTSWPIKGGETFTLTFSIHDEGDAVYDSVVLLDNFQWHTYEAVGTTDPLN